jgi:hypothetical protein
LLQRLKRSHHSKVKPVAAPSKGARAMAPLPTTLPVTIMLGPINLILCKREVGALFIGLL